MTAALLPNGKVQYIDINGKPLVDGKVYFYIPNTTTPKDTWQDEAQNILNTNPITLDSRGQATIWGNGAYRQIVKDADGNTIWDKIAALPGLTVLGAMARDFSNRTAELPMTATDFIQAGAGAVTRTGQNKLREVQLSITDFGGEEGLAFDNTAAFGRAVAALGNDGGVVSFPPGDWRGNFFVNQSNVVLQGQGGIGEEDRACLRPWVTTPGSYTLRFSDGTRVNRKCGIENLVVSGDDGSGNQADSALWLSGGTVHFWAHRYELMDGLISLNVVPSGGQPVTASGLTQGNIRNDLSSTASRAMYIIRKAGNEYVTGFGFVQLHVNKSGGGYAAEFDGTAVGLTVWFSQAYWDVPPAGCILEKGAVTLIGDPCQLDPGALAVEIIKTDQTSKNIAQYLQGTWIVDGNKMTFGDASQITFPPGMITFGNSPAFSQPSAIGKQFFALAANPVDQSVYLEPDGTALNLYGADLRIRKDAYIYGANVAAGAKISALSPSGGFYVESLVANQGMRFDTSGTAGFQFTGTFLQPRNDNATDLGGSSNRWTTVYAVTGTINTSDARAKKVRGALTDQELAAWARVQPIIYQWLDAIDEKGEAGARLHAGYTSQQVRDAFLAEGLNPADYALWCEDALFETIRVPRMETRPIIDKVEAVDFEIVEEGNQAVRRQITRTVEQVRTVTKPVVDENGEPVMKVVRGKDLVPTFAAFPVFEEVEVFDEVQQPTGETRLGLRPDQCWAFEAAFQRTRGDRIEARLAALEAA